MKKALLILSFILVSIISFAQRQRTTAVFDSDTTRPKNGMYGITVIKKQPYLVGSTGNAQRIEVSPLFIKDMSFGTVTTTATLPLDYEHITICRDSTNVVLPNKTAAGNGKRYYITFLGLRGFTADTVKRWLPWDDTFYLSFSDTIFFKKGEYPFQTTHFTKVFTNKRDSSWCSVCNPHTWSISWRQTNSFFRISAYQSVYIELIDNRWYLFFADIKF